MKNKVTVTINGASHSHEVEPRLLLVHFIRELAGLTGTHVGCDTSQCGACVVEYNGEAVKSCTVLAVQAEGANVKTIEGLANGNDLHPMQAMFREHHALQCGFCTPGMVLAAVDMCNRYKKLGKKLDEKAVRHELEGNLCRCTGYHNIVKAILAAAPQLGA